MLTPLLVGCIHLYLQHLSGLNSTRSNSVDSGFGYIANVDPEQVRVESTDTQVQILIWCVLQAINHSTLQINDKITTYYITSDRKYGHLP